ERHDTPAPAAERGFADDRQPVRRLLIELGQVHLLLVGIPPFLPLFAGLLPTRSVAAERNGGPVLARDAPEQLFGSPGPLGARVGRQPGYLGGDLLVAALVCQGERDQKLDVLVWLFFLLVLHLWPTRLVVGAGKGLGRGAATQRLLALER